MDVLRKALACTRSMHWLLLVQGMQVAQHARCEPLAFTAAASACL
jgi:hypothetical protein